MKHQLKARHCTWLIEDICYGIAYSDSQNVDIHFCHLLFDHFQFTLIHGPNISGSFVIFFFTTSEFYFCHESHSQLGIVFALAQPLHFFLESFLHSFPVAYWAPIGLGSSSFSAIYLFAFYTVHGVLKVTILKWFCHCFLQWTMFGRNSPP